MKFFHFLFCHKKQLCLKIWLYSCLEINFFHTKTKSDLEKSEDKGWSLTEGRCRTSVVSPAHGAHPSQ